MSAMGVLFIVMAAIIMIRNLVLFNIEHCDGCRWRFLALLGIL
jgi:hypothetical protein